MTPTASEKTAIASFILVFVCGCALGAAAMSTWLHPKNHPNSVWPGGVNMSVAEWNRELELTPDQSRQLASVLDDFSVYYNDLLADGNTRILKILNPKQKALFERMLKEHRK
jgi:Spy/CpxP family protein refolding chaperone